METKKLIGLSAIILAMAGALIIAIPLTTGIFAMMNKSNTVLNFIGAFLYILVFLSVLITEYSLYKEFRKILGDLEKSKKEKENQ
jgi:hypothetical protein